MYDPNQTSDYADAVVTGVVADGLRDPLNNPLQDSEIYRARVRAEKTLKPAPPDRRTAIEAMIESVEQAGGFLDDSVALPQTLAQWNEELRREQEAAERERIRRLLFS